MDRRLVEENTLYLEAIEEESEFDERKDLVLNALASLLAKKVDSQRNLIDASTCLVEAVFKNNSALTQMMTSAILPLVGRSDEFEYSKHFADAIKRGSKASIIQNLNQIWLKTQHISQTNQAAAVDVKMTTESKDFENILGLYADFMTKYDIILQTS